MSRGSEVGRKLSAGGRGKRRTENGGLPTEMSETLPKGWIEIDLDKIVIYGKGKKPKTLTPKNDIGLVPYVNIKGFEKGIIDEYADVKSSKLINKTEILVVWDGARFGLTGMGMEGAAGSTLMVLTPVLNKPEYIYNFINRHYSYINSKPKGTGTPHVNPDIFWKLQFPIAPLNEQKRIVAKLDKIMPRIDAVKERLNKVPAIIKRFKQSVLTAAVTGNLTEKWRVEHPDVKSAEVLLTEIREKRNNRYKQDCAAAETERKRKPKFCIPPMQFVESENDCANWIDIEIQQIYDIGTGGTPLKSNNAYYTNGNVPWVKSGDVQNKEITQCGDYITEIALRETNVKFYPINSLLIAMYGEGKTRGQIGKLKFEATSNQACAALVNEDMPQVIIDYTFLFGLSQYEHLRMQSAGGNQPNLNLTKIKEWKIPFPPLEEQHEIVRQVDKLFALADRLESHYQKAKARVDKLSQSVLAKAFRGELVITEAELAEKEGRDFESAEKLLERILEEKAKLVGSRQRTVGGVRSARGSKGKQKETGGNKK